MTRLFTRRGWLALTGVLGAVMTLPLVVPRLPEIFLVNETRSLPRGLYVRRFHDAPDRGRLVAFAQPEAARSYLAKLGAPPDMMLLKRVAAVGGDHVCLKRDRLHAPGAGVRVMGQDRAGAPLPHWTGCRILETDELFLLGDSPESFDSRYFGPVRLQDTKGVFATAATW
jgi:conjugative transfer signal peptidase TraF